MDSKEDMLKEIKSLQLRVATCDKFLSELMELINKHWYIGAQLDYKRVEADKYKYLTQAANLKQKIKKLDEEGDDGYVEPDHQLCLACQATYDANLGGCKEPICNWPKRFAML